MRSELANRTRAKDQLPAARPRLRGWVPVCVALATGLVLSSLCAGCDYYKEQTGYLVTHAERFSHHYNDPFLCKPQIECDIDEFRFTMVHQGVTYTVRCEHHDVTQTASDCSGIQAGEAYQCTNGSALGDKWLDCDSYMLELDSSRKN
jgi:hypothetical protein